MPTSLTTDLEALSYLASHGDLIGAFGSDIEAAKSHYENYGLSEGRTITFDPAQYLSNYDDLTQAFGSDYERATRHFINFGHKEGRTFESSATTSNATADPTTKQYFENL